MLRQRILTKSPTLNVMIDAALKAGRSLVRDFGEIEKLQVSKKGPANFVSNADHKAEKIIYESLIKARPDFGFLMEESGEVKGTDSDNRWIIDPLDGTTNFLHGIPRFAVSIAHEKNKEIVAGVIYDPILDEAFWAEKGGGAFTNSQRLRVSGRTTIEESLFMTGYHFGQPRDLLFKRMASLYDKTAILRMLGSATLSLAYVASGRSEGYFEETLQPWDVAAGILLVREAGGFVTEVTGGEHPEEGHSILATTPLLYDSLKQLL